MLTVVLVQENRPEILNKYALNDGKNAYSIYCDGERVGMLEWRFSGELIFIDSLDIDLEHQRRGIGRKVVEMLFDRYQTAIIGDAVVDSASFWRSIGANFDGEDEYNMDYYIKESLCLPFIIEDVI